MNHRHHLLTLMLFQIGKTFVHLQNTDEDIFYEICEVSVPDSLCKDHFDASKSS